MKNAERIAGKQILKGCLIKQPVSINVEIVELKEKLVIQKEFNMQGQIEFDYKQAAYLHYHKHAFLNSYTGVKMSQFKVYEEVLNDKGEKVKIVVRQGNMCPRCGRVKAN